MLETITVRRTYDGYEMQGSLTRRLLNAIDVQLPGYAKPVRFNKAKKHFGPSDENCYRYMGMSVAFAVRL